MTDITFSDTELQLIQRVLFFAEGDLPISDRKGNTLYPTQSTIKLTRSLLARIEAAGIEVASGLFTPFDPNSLKDRITTVWQEDYELT